MRFFGQVSVRLFLLLTALLAAAFTIVVQLTLRVHQTDLEQALTEGAARTSEVILYATRQAMIENSRFHVEQIISAVGQQAQVDRVRIYNKSGEVVVSTEHSDIGRLVDTEAEACAACHTDGDLRIEAPRDELSRLFQAADGHRVLGFIAPIRNQPECGGAACHPPPTDQRILGVLDLQLSLAADDAALTVSRNQMIRSGLLVSLITALVAWLFIRIVVHRPVGRLIRGTQSVARLELDVDLGRRSDTEIGVLASNFERMAGKLRRALDENEEWAESLQQKVREKAEQLQQAQGHLVHMEKMASLGKLSAVVAHEINNPLAGVLTYARLISRRLGQKKALSDEDRARLSDHLALIDSETRRCGEVVKSLLIFSKRSPGELRNQHLNELLDRSVRLIRHALEMNRVELVREGSAIDDALVCDGDQIQQMCVALLVNASEAMPDGGVLRVEVAVTAKDRLRLSIADTGTGIPVEVQSRIFEPFFTTKEPDSGLGIGLSVVHGIVESHGGSIEVQSSPGKGTRFRIELQREPPERPGSPVKEAPDEHHSI